MSIVYTNNLDMHSGGVPLIVHLGQYDSDFSLVFNLYSSVGALTIESGTTAEIRGTKSDGFGYSADATIDIVNKKVTVAGSNQMTAAARQNIFELVLLKNNKVLSSANFILDVEHAALDADTIQDESVLKELNAIIEGAATATQAAEDAEDAADRAEEAADDLSGTVQQVATNTQDIANLKDDLSNISTEDVISEKEEITFNAPPYYIDLSGTTADVNSPIQNPYADFRYAVVPCSEGDVFIVTARGGNAPRAWGFVGSTGMVLDVAPATAYVQNLKLVAPSEVAYLVINDLSESESYKVTTLDETLEQIDSEFDSKVDKQQDVADKGKALIIGDDGIVVAGEAGIPNSVKVALLDCIAHVVWSDSHGQDYYDALEEALYPEPPEPDPTLLYNLENTVFDGVDDIINTGINVMNSDVDWTLIFDITDQPPAQTISETYTPILFNDMLYVSPWPGVQIIKRHDSPEPPRFQVNLWNKTYFCDMDLTTDHRIKCCITHSANNAPVIPHVYIDGSSVSMIDRWPNRVFEFTSLSSDFYATVGNSIDNRTGSERTFWWKGIVHMLKIYNRVLTNQEIIDLLS